MSVAMVIDTPNGPQDIEARGTGERTRPFLGKEPGPAPGAAGAPGPPPRRGFWPLDRLARTGVPA